MDTTSNLVIEPGADAAGEQVADRFGERLSGDERRLDPNVVWLHMDRAAGCLCRCYSARDDGEMNDALPVLVVDAANVVGSWPDGWWRDRLDAAIRLRDALEPLSDDHEVILVVEGQARRLAATDRVGVVAATGSGDDEIVRVAASNAALGRRVIVVTADRGLRRRLAETRAELAGPRSLPYKGR